MCSSSLLPHNRNFLPLLLLRWNIADTALNSIQSFNSGLFLFCLFVCFILFSDIFFYVVNRHTRELSIEQWGFFSLPHLLWYGASVYNHGQFRETVTLATVAERLAVEPSLPVPVLATSVCRCWDVNTKPSR